MKRNSMRMGRMLCLVFVFCMLFSLCVTATDSYAVGEVLYHQNFDGIGNLRCTGIRMGTVSSESTKLKTDGEALRIDTYDDRRNYALLPEIPWTDDYTVEFTFSFQEVRARNGYLAFLLTCWGDEPSNITGLVFRANGTIDDFAPLSEDVKAAIAAGEEPIHVTIPVENGILYEVTVEVGDAVDTVKRSSLKRIPEGNRGFGIRNTSAAIQEVFVVNGTGYTAKTGDFAEASWSDDPTNQELTGSPDTGDSVGLAAAMTASLLGTLLAKRTKRNHRI